MKRATGIAGAMSLAVLLTVTGCGSTSAASHTNPDASPSATTSAHSGTTPPPTTALMVLVTRKSNSKPPTSTIEIIDYRGHVTASTDFSPPGRPYMAACAVIPPP